MCADEETVTWSREQLSIFLSGIINNSSYKTIDIVSHSMGARLLMETLNYMDKKPNSFRNIILASPDIESDTFFNLFHRSKDVFKKMTLYNNAGDLALLASKFIHTHPRAGIRGNIDFYQRKIDIIETSNLERLFSLGHASFAENRAVISDIYYIIKNELGPQERAGLIRNTNGQKKTSYWKFKA